jgi:hypothetical protein
MNLKYTKIKNRMGVITTVDIAPNTVICEFIGKLYTDKTLHELSKDVDVNVVLQIGPNVYIGPSGGVTDYIAHSCNPNCFIHAVSRRAFLYSLHFIRLNSEITFDYSSTSTDDLDSWRMECNCGANNCRGTISGFHLLDKNLQEEYKKKDIAALFIREPIFNRK